MGAGRDGCGDLFEVMGHGRRGGERVPGIFDFQTWFPDAFPCQVPCCLFYIMELGAERRQVAYSTHFEPIEPQAVTRIGEAPGATDQGHKKAQSGRGRDQKHDQ